MKKRERNYSRTSSDRSEHWNLKYLLIFIVLICLVFVENVLAVPVIEFVNPTPSNCANITTPLAEINISITESDLGEFKFGWNGTNYTFYNDSLVLMYNFENLSALGENGTYVVDVSNGKNNGTITGAIWTSSGKYGGGYYFGGNGDYIQIPDNESLRFDSNITDFTISVWVKRLNSGVDDMIIDKRDGDNDGWRLLFAAGDDKIYASVDYTDVTSSTAITDTNWHHVVFVVDRDGNGQIYIDGIADGNAVAINSDAMATTSNVVIGKYSYSASGYFNGTIDDVRIYNRSLLPGEIRQHYHSNLHKYDINKWNFYTNQSDFVGLGENNYSVYAEDEAGNSNINETKVYLIYTKTTDYYDNRKAVVVWTGDDWEGSNNQKFMSASDAAQKYKVIFSPGILPGGVFKYDWPGLNSSQWEDIQTQIDEGFVSPVSHSMSHRGDVYNYTENGTSYEIEINGSKNAIIGNLTLPWQNWFNGSEYLVGWIEPYGYSDSQVRVILNESNYLIARKGPLGVSSFSSWSSDGLYERYGYTVDGDSASLTELNNNFSTIYSNGGIYHFFIHPWDHNWTDTDKIPQHLAYIGNKTDVWYVGWGDLYMYHYLENETNPTIESVSINDDNTIINATISVSGVKRNRYGLSYPLTYKFSFLNDWSNVFVFYKNTSNDNYTALTKKNKQ